MSKQSYVVQAIRTVFIPPTNTRGSRYKATADAGSITVSADDAGDAFNNHVRAADALCEKLSKGREKGSPWLRPRLAGGLPDGSMAHVFDPR